MSRWVLLFLCAISIIYVDGWRNITLSVEKTDSGSLACKSQPRFILDEGVPTMLYILSYGDITQPECSTAEKKEMKITNISEHMDSVYKANVVKAPPANITCCFNVNNTTVSCDFEIGIKYSKSLTVYINDQQLVTYTAPSEVDAELTYNFIPNERVKFACYKPSTYGYLQYYVSHYNFSSPAEDTHLMYFEAILKPRDHLSYVDCMFLCGHVTTVVRTWMILNIEIEANIKVNDLAVRPLYGNTVLYGYHGEIPKVTCNDTPMQLNAECGGTTLRLHKEYYCNGFNITGLSDSKIIFQTCQNTYSDIIIYYEFTEGDIISIGCEDGGHEEKWKLDDVLSADEASTSEGSSIFTRKMTKKYNSSSITCSHNDNKNMIIFLYATNDGSENNGYSVIGIVGGVLAIALLLMLVLIVLICRRRRKLLENTQDHSNLDPNSQNARSRHNENIYSNGNQTAEYVFPTDMKETYCEPHQPRLEDIYTKPTPKNMRAHEVKYAEIVFKNGHHAQVKDRNTESPYAEIQHNEDMYATVKKETGENNFSTYVNGSLEENYEPAYCEVGAIRN